MVAQEWEPAACPGPGPAISTLGGSPHLREVKPRAVRLKIDGAGIDKVTMTGSPAWAMEELEILLMNERVREVIVTFEVASEGAVAPAAPPPPAPELPMTPEDFEYFYSGVAWG